jgi:hypothetical protein
VAAALKQDPDLQVDLIDGAKGEFTVLVDGREVIRKGASLPEVDDVLAAVRKAEPVRAAG